jgi:hypothetical protein
MIRVGPPGVALGEGAGEVRERPLATSRSSPLRLLVSPWLDPYIGAPGGGKLDHIDPSMTYFYPSPRDMYGLMAELCKVDMRDDPRLLQTWSSQVKMWRSAIRSGSRAWPT